MRISHACFCTMRANGGHGPHSKELPNVGSHHGDLFNRQACYSYIIGDFESGAPGKSCTCVVPFRRWMPASARPRERFENGRAPRCCPGRLPLRRRRRWRSAFLEGRWRATRSDPKSGGFDRSLARDFENGGLCGHCSRDPPLDRRMLFVAELTGRFESGGLCR